jgi:hypothetical protein
MADGRHAVMDATGAVMGMHKSPFSAARQIHEYYGPVQPVEPGDVEPAREAVEAKGVGSKQSGVMEHPKIAKPTDKRPKSFSAPKIPKP